MKTGSCLCGGIAYELHGDLRASVACHCLQCRKTSGHYLSATQVDGPQLRLTREGALTWSAPSDKAERGVCNACGSSLFWRHADDGEAVSAHPGTIDSDTGLITATHIFTAFKGDYYDIPDGVRQQKD